jgi:hypothetical protein
MKGRQKNWNIEIKKYYDENINRISKTSGTLLRDQANES